MKKRRTHKRRRYVELYFILYLAALILLLPDKRQKTMDSDSVLTALFQQSFTLQPEKTVLSARIVVDSAGAKIIAPDTANLIVFTGNIRDAHYQFLIEDPALGQTLRLSSDSASPAPMFRIEQRDDLRAIKFIWKPAATAGMRSRSYSVRVIATATPVAPPGNIALEQMIADAGTRLTAETQFAVNIINDGEPETQSKIALVPPMSGQEGQGVPLIQQNITQPPIVITQQSRPPSGDFSISPFSISIGTIAYHPWSNRIFITGTQSGADLKRTPIVKIERSSADIGGNAEIAEIRGNEILLRGTAPSSGVMRVSVTAERAADGRTATVEFNVQPQPFAAPIVSRIMNPGISYTIQPNIPLLTNTDAKAVLYDGTQERISSPQGAAFEFTPDARDTGKVLTLARIVGGRQIGDRISIRIENFPSPEILGISRQKNGSTQITTRSFGLWNGRDNRASIVIIDGNARARELYGNFRTDAKSLAHTQVFEIVPKNPDATFTFRCRVVDLRGASSATRAIGKDE
ncbi:hypothetical protein MASR2M18_16190 [Ignavibacteria bacterium]|nr:hypothetical protein [Bacteroidota bacterium]